MTRGLLGEAGLSLLPVRGAGRSVNRGEFSREEMPDFHTGQFYECLAKLKADTTVANFLRRHFAVPEYVTRMVESHDAADPARASMLALREEWTDTGRSVQERMVAGYGALVDLLATDSRSTFMQL